VFGVERCLARQVFPNDAHKQKTTRHQDIKPPNTIYGSGPRFATNDILHWLSFIDIHSMMFTRAQFKVKKIVAVIAKVLSCFCCFVFFCFSCFLLLFCKF